MDSWQLLWLTFSALAVRKKEPYRGQKAVTKTAPATPSESKPPRVTTAAGLRIRPWLFRLAAITLAPLVFLGILEIGLRLAGIGDPTSLFLKSRGHQRPVIIDNQRFGRRFFPPALVRYPRPFIFDAVKSPKCCRLFVLGESAAMGDPEPAHGFSRVLEVLLRERYPDWEFEVVNVAITAINSHVIRSMAQECARQPGDFWVIYMGNNEVIGPYGAGTVFGAQVPRLSVIRAGMALRATRFGQVLGSLWRPGIKEKKPSGCGAEWRCSWINKCAWTMLA